MEERIIIQEEIAVNQEFIDKVIKNYQEMADNLSIGIDSWSGKKDDIIKEINKLSPIGKHILMMHYRFEEWQKSDEYKKLKEEAEAEAKQQQMKGGKTNEQQIGYENKKNKIDRR